MKHQFRVLCSMFILTVSILSSQSIALADSLSGRVLDPDGNIVANAQLRLFDRTSGLLRQATTAADGSYAFAGLVSGDYLLEADGAASALSAATAVSVNGDVNVNLTLKVAGVSVEVFVTASSTPLSLQEVAKAVDVVDAEEIALRDELSIAEAIRNLPGVRVKTLEGPGSFTTIRTRGLRGQDTALLIDGLRFRDAASPQGDATAFLQSMTTVDTERVEFMRGSGSSLYGSNAMAGVINIVSRSGGGPPHGEIRVEGGGLGMIRTVAGMGGGLAKDRFTYSGTVSYVNVTRGVRDGNTFRSTSPQGTFRYNFTDNVSVTGRLWYSNDRLQSTESPAFPASVLDNFPASGTVRAIALPTDQLELFEQGLQFNAGTATFAPNRRDPDGHRESSFLNGSVSLQHQLFPNTSYRVSYQGVDTNRAFIDGPLRGGDFEPAIQLESNFDGRIDTIRARIDSDIGDYNFVSVGYEYERENYFDQNSSNTATASIEQKSHSFYAQDQIRLLDGRLHVTIGGRLQSFDPKDPVFVGGESPYAGISFDSPTAYTGDAAVAYFVQSSGTKFRAHIGNSYRAPAPFERFGGSFSSFSGSFSYWGDPRLNSERSVALDGGIDQWLFHSKLQLSTTVFYTNLQETIIFDFANFPASTDLFGRFGGYRNSGGGIARGLEFSAQASPVSATNLRLAYTYTNSDSRTPTISSDFFEIPGLSKHMFTLTATQWIAQRFNVTFDLFAVSDYSLSPFGARGRRMIFGGPVKADVVLRYDLPIATDRTMELYTKIENAFNQRYYEDGFLGPGAWAIAGFRIHY